MASREFSTRGVEQLDISVGPRAAIRPNPDARDTGRRPTLFEGLDEALERLAVEVYQNWLG